MGQLFVSKILGESYDTSVHDCSDYILIQCHANTIYVQLPG